MTLKIGDLVRPKDPTQEWYHNISDAFGCDFSIDPDWIGVITGFDGVEPIVYWNSDFPKEIEYPEQLVVINNETS